MTFNFTGLRNIYQQALRSDGKSLAFEVSINKGHFLFMMFLSKEDGGDRDILFLYLRHMNQLLRIKTYGSHREGDFKVYLTNSELNMMIEELQLRSGEKQFLVERFLNELNDKIPSQLSMEEVHETLKMNSSHVPVQVIDEPEKTVLIGFAKLPYGKKPQDKTLRKLYVFAGGSYSVISSLIEKLKSNNYTVRWTSEKYREKAASINDFLNNSHFPISGWNESTKIDS